MNTWNQIQVKWCCLFFVLITLINLLIGDVVTTVRTTLELKQYLCLYIPRWSQRLHKEFSSSGRFGSRSVIVCFCVSIVGSGSKRCWPNKQNGMKQHLLNVWDQVRVISIVAMKASGMEGCIRRGKERGQWEVSGMGLKSCKMGVGFHT